MAVVRRVGRGRRVLGVVFVHGIGSSPEMWDGFGDLIAGDEELAGVVGEPQVRFGYATRLFMPRGLLRVIPSLDTAADSLKEYLVTEAGEFERLVLVGHSQGGLVIQRCLVRMLSEGRGRELTRVRRVVLLATPNSGSQLLLGLRRRFVWGNAQERALRPFDELVTDTRRTVMRDLVNAPKVTERTCPIPFSVYAGESDAVVTPASARDVFPEAAALPGDHFQIAKPKSRQDRTYSTVRRLLREAAAEGDRDPPEPDARVRVLRTGVVPAPPDWAVAREQTEVVVAAVVGAGPSTTVGITTAVYGAGGFGKSTVAQLVCADPRVRERFGNRVYWVTVGLGQRTRDQIRAKVAEATFLITGENNQLADPSEAGSYLGSLLQEAEQPILLVLDDVWEVAQLLPFQRGAPNCVRLVTTRIKAVLTQQATTVLVDRLEPAQALALLTAGLPGVPANLAERLVARCGRWALLLRLANRWIADQTATDDDPARHARALLDRLHAGPAAVDRPEAMVDVEDPQARNDLVAASMGASLGLLLAPARRRFLELGAFTPDEPIPIRVLARLWSWTSKLDEVQVRRACRDLENLALITIDPSDGGAVLVHDVLHSYARAVLGIDGIRRTSLVLIRAIEDALPVADRLDHAAQGPRAAWWSLDPEVDGYLIDHAIELLCAADEFPQAEALAGDLRWIEARLLQRGPTTPIRDLIRVGGPGAQARAADLMRIAHLLTPAEPPHAAIDTLHSYLQPLISWSWSVATLSAQPAPHARLVNAWPPPDLPEPTQRNTLPNGLDPVVTNLQTLKFSQDGNDLMAGGTSLGPLMVLRYWHLDTGALAHSVHVGPAPSGTTKILCRDESGITHEMDFDFAIADKEPDSSRSAALHGLLELVMHQLSMVTASYVVIAGLFTGFLGGFVSVVTVTAVAIASTGEWFVAGDSAGSLRIWRTSPVELISTLRGHDGEVSAIAIAPGGTWLVTGGSDQTLRIWDVAGGNLVRTLAGHHRTVRVVTVSPDGTTIASSADDGTVHVWDVATGERTRTLHTNTMVTALAVSPDGTRLAIGGGSLMSTRVQVWDLPIASPRPIPGQVGAGAALELYRRGVLAPRSGPRRVRVWDPSTEVPRDPPTGRIAVAISPQGVLATSDWDHSVRVWRLPSNAVVRTLVGHTSFVRSIAIGPDDSIASADDNGMVQLWHPGTGRLTETQTRSRDQLHAVTFTPSGTCIAAYRDADAVRIWNVRTGRLLHALYNLAAVHPMRFSPNGARLATCGSDRSVRIWDTATGALVRVVSVAGDAVSAVAFSPDANHIAVVENGAQGLIRVWNVATGAPEHTFAGHGWNSTMAFAPDGAWLAVTSAGDGNATMRIWDLSRGVCAAALVADEQFLHNAAWGPILVATGLRGLHGYLFKPAGV